MDAMSMEEFAPRTVERSRSVTGTAIPYLPLRFHIRRRRRRI